MKTGINEIIKQKAKTLFFSHGLKSVSMDDIAKECGISKKTIYQFFADRNQLIHDIVEDLVQSYETLFEIAQTNSGDAVDEVLKQDNELIKVWTGIRPSFFYELEKYFPEVFELLTQYKSHILDSIINNLKRGKEEAVYRDDIDIPLISDLRMHQLVNVLQPDSLTRQKISVHQLAGEFTELYLHSITTGKGKKLLYKYLNQTWR